MFPTPRLLKYCRLPARWRAAANSQTATLAADSDPAGQNLTRAELPVATLTAAGPAASRSRRYGQSEAQSHGESRVNQLDSNPVGARGNLAVRTSPAATRAARQRAPAQWGRPGRAKCSPVVF